MRVAVTRIERDGAMQRRVVDTCTPGCSDRARVGGPGLACLAVPPPYRPVPGCRLYQVSVDGGGQVLVAEIIFDPERTSYREMLEFFFQIHDPTTKNRQGKYTGLLYRSEIFCTSDEQRQLAEDTIADVDASGLWPATVVTEISDADPFWEAEAEDQDYLQRYPDGYTCHYPRPNWKLPYRETVA